MIRWSGFAIWTQSADTIKYRPTSTDDHAVQKPAHPAILKPKLS